MPGKPGTYIRTPEFRKQQSEAHKGEKHNWFGKKHSEQTKQKISKTHVGYKHTESARKKMSTSHKGRQLSQDTKQKLSRLRLGLPKTEEWKRRISESNKGKHPTPCGEDNPNWRGGRRVLYCPKFNEELKEEIRNMFGRKCFLCGSSENGERLSIHHCDYNKGQGCGQKWSLVSLCRSCHTKTGNHRHHYFNLLSNYWISKYICGEDFGGFFPLHRGCGPGPER